MFHSITDILQTTEKMTAQSPKLDALSPNSSQNSQNTIQIPSAPIQTPSTTPYIQNFVSNSIHNPIFQQNTQIQALQQQILLNSLVQNMMNQTPTAINYGLTQNFNDFNIPVLNELTFRASRRKGGQIRFTAEQTNKLEDLFRGHKYLTPQQRKVISGDLSLKNCW